MSSGTASLKCSHSNCSFETNDHEALAAHLQESSTDGTRWVCQGPKCNAKFCCTQAMDCKGGHNYTCNKFVPWATSRKYGRKMPVNSRLEVMSRRSAAQIAGTAPSGPPKGFSRRKVPGKRKAVKQNKKQHEEQADKQDEDEEEGDEGSEDKEDFELDNLASDESQDDDESDSDNSDFEVKARARWYRKPRAPTQLSSSRKRKATGKDGIEDNAYEPPMKRVTRSRNLQVLTTGSSPDNSDRATGDWPTTKSLTIAKKAKIPLRLDSTTKAPKGGSNTKPRMLQATLKSSSTRASNTARKQREVLPHSIPTAAQEGEEEEGAEKEGVWHYDQVDDDNANMLGAISQAKPAKITRASSADMEAEAYIKPHHYGCTQCLSHHATIQDAQAHAAQSNRDMERWECMGCSAPFCGSVKEFLSLHFEVCGLLKDHMNRNNIPWSRHSDPEFLAMANQSEKRRSWPARNSIRTDTIHTTGDKTKFAWATVSRDWSAQVLKHTSNIFWDGHSWVNVNHAEEDETTHEDNHLVAMTPRAMPNAISEATTSENGSGTSNDSQAGTIAGDANGETMVPGANDAEFWAAAEGFLEDGEEQLWAHMFGGDQIEATGEEASEDQGGQTWTPMPRGMFDEFD